jgi:hypothetical protein
MGHVRASHVRLCVVMAVPLSVRSFHIVLEHHLLLAILYSPNLPDCSLERSLNDERFRKMTELLQSAI